MRHFIGLHYNEDSVSKFVKFDHQSKKLKFISGNSEDKINLSYYQSLVKVDNFVPDKFSNSSPGKIEVEGINKCISEVVLGHKLINYLIGIQNCVIKD